MSATPRQRLIEATIELIRRRGASGVSISELMDQSRTARQSIYTHFPGGKRELIEQSVRAAGDSMSAMIELLAPTSPLDALGTFVRYWKSTVEASDYTAGCPIAAAALGVHESPDAVVAARDAFEAWVQILSRTMTTRGLDMATSNSLASTVTAAIEGAVIMSIAARSTETLDQVHRHLAELLVFHLDQTSQPGRPQ